MLDAVSSYLASLSSGVRGRSGELLQTLRMWNSLLVPPLTTELSAAYIWVWNWAELGLANWVWSLSQSQSKGRHFDHYLSEYNGVFA